VQRLRPSRPVRSALAGITCITLLGAVTTVGLIAGAQSAAADTIPHRWQIVFPHWDRTSSPHLADVDGDDRLDIVFGAQDGWLRVLSSEGRALTGWPRQAVVGGAPVAIDSTPGIGDLDRDGRPEIAVGVGSTWRPNQQGGLVVFNANGSTRCVYRTRDVHNIWVETGVPDGYSDGVYSSPAIGDVDGNGYADIVFGGFDLRIHAIDRNCRPIRGFPYYANDTVWSSPALHDVDRDGRDEIFIGADWYANGPSDPASGGRFRRLDWTNGAAVVRWTRSARDVYTSSPAIGDIDGDGRLEAVVGGGDFFHQADGQRVFAYHLTDGSTVAGWPRSTTGVTRSSPALGDLTGDGVAEVVIGSRDGQVHAYRGNGSALWHRRPQGSNLVGSPLIADFDGDGRQDVGIGNSFAFWLLRGRDGATLGSVNEVISFESSGAVGDFGAAGRLLVTVGFDTPNFRTRVRATPLPRAFGTDAWPMFGRNARNRRSPGGDAPIVPECHSRASVFAPTLARTPFRSGPAINLDGRYDLIAPVNPAGDRYCDFVLYGRGAGADALYVGASSGPRATPIVIAGTFDAVIPGDFDGDGHGDIVLYARGAAPDVMRRGGRDGLGSGPAIEINGAYDFALPGDFNGDGFGDIFFYDRGPGADLLRLGSRTGRFFSAPPIDIDASYDLAVAGDFNGDGVSDVFFYGRGSAPDRLVLGTGFGVFNDAPALAIDSVCDAIVPGDFNGDGPADFLCYGRGNAGDMVRRGTGLGVFMAPITFTIDAPFDLFAAGDVNGDRHTDLLAFNRGTAGDRLWYGN